MASGPPGHDHAEAGVAADTGQNRQRFLVEILDVIDQQQQLHVLCAKSDNAQDGLGGDAIAVARLQGGQPVAEIADEPFKAARLLGGKASGDGGIGAKRAQQIDQMAHRRAKAAERYSRRQRIAPDRYEGDTEPGGDTARFQQQAAFAHARLARYGKARCIARGRRRHGASHLVHKGVAPDHGIRRAALDRHAVASGKIDRDKFERGFARTVDAGRNGACGAQFARFRNQRGGGRRNRHGARRCQLFDLSGNVRGMADDVDDAAEIVVLPPQQDRSGMQPHPRLRCGQDPEFSAFHAVDDAPSRQRSAQRVIFGRRVDAEDRHHPIALDTDHKSVEFVDGLLHDLDRAVEQIAGIFGIERADEPGRTHDVGKQDRGEAHRFKFGCKAEVSVRKAWNRAG